MNALGDRRLALAAAVLALAAFTAGARPSAAQPWAPVTSSQGTLATPLPARGEELDQRAIPPPGASFYNIAGSALTPVASTTTLVYDMMGCVHVNGGAAGLLNAPLEVPDGSRLALLRMYYYDTDPTLYVQGWITTYNELGTDFQDLVAVASNTNTGFGSNFGTLDHEVDAYSSSYVLNVKLNGAINGLKICGLRLMYYAPVLFRDGFESGNASAWSAAVP